MPAVATKADALRIESGSTEVRHLTAIGSIAGVVVQAVAARCGEGIAKIRSTAAGVISFRAPGSETWGPDVAADAEGAYLLVDGEDRDKWLRVYVYPDYLLAPREARIFLHDRFNNAVASDDVSAAEAAAGDVEAYELDLANDGNVILSQVRAWIDEDVDGIEISPNGSDWSAPTSEAAGLELADVPPGESVALHVRRTITAGAEADPEVLNFLHLSFSGL